ncbi:MAG: hypothetical protein JWM89_2681 [Acidimicrobiales bacterium]|nr:hypothetical protein [Acidimicrobiales bacterium]
MAPASAGSRSVDGSKQLHAACRLALAVAKEGELATPRVPAPAILMPVLRFTRLSAAAYATVARAIDEDDAFRARVASAEGADEHALGQAGWLWLHRPEGWTAAGHAAAVQAADGDAGDGTDEVRAKEERARAKAKAGSARRREAAEAEARRRAREQLAAARKQTADAVAERDALRTRVGALETERNQAVRATKVLEGDLAAARRDLKVARQATREAEAELAELRRVPPVTSDPAVAAAVAAAASAASELARNLSATAEALLPAARSVAGSPAPGKAKGRRPRGARRLPPLPPGAFDGSPEANRHLVTSGDATLVVDGYNLARAAWSGLDPEEERRRTVALLEEVRARSKAPVYVVFDGDSSMVAPVASRAVRVLFSPTDVTADDEIARLLGELPVAHAIVVVSSDRAVAADARRQGAATLSSADFLAAAGR